MDSSRAIHDAIAGGTLPNEPQVPQIISRTESMAQLPRCVEKFGTSAGAICPTATDRRQVPRRPPAPQRLHAGLQVLVTRFQVGNPPMSCRAGARRTSPDRHVGTPTCTAAPDARISRPARSCGVRAGSHQRAAGHRTPDELPPVQGPPGGPVHPPESGHSPNVVLNPFGTRPCSTARVVRKEPVAFRPNVVFLGGCAPTTAPQAPLWFPIPVRLAGARSVGSDWCDKRTCPFRPNAWRYRSSGDSVRSPNWPGRGPWWVHEKVGGGRSPALPRWP